MEFETKTYFEVGYVDSGKKNYRTKQKKWKTIFYFCDWERYIDGCQGVDS